MVTFSTGLSAVSSVKRWFIPALREICIAMGVGTLLVVAAMLVWEWASRLPFQFDEIEIAYLPAQDSHRVYIGIHYIYRGGCSKIAWTHSAIDRSGNIYQLGTYEGPVRWAEIDERGLFQSVEQLDNPMPEGIYEWRGLMVCTSGSGQSEKQTPIWTSIKRLYVEHDLSKGLSRSPLAGLGSAWLFTPL